MASKIDEGDEVVLRRNVARVDPEDGKITVVFGSGVRFTIRSDSSEIVEVIKQQVLSTRSRKTMYDKLPPLSRLI